LLDLHNITGNEQKNTNNILKSYITKNTIGMVYVKKVKRKLQAVTVDLATDQIDFIEKKAKKDGTNKAKIIRQALDDQLGLPLEVKK